MPVETVKANVAVKGTCKPNPNASMNPTRLVIHYLLQCVNRGNTEAAALLLQENVKCAMLEEESAKLKDQLLVMVRSVANQGFDGNTTNVVKAADLYLKHYT